MITGATKAKVDDVWQRMWEGGITNPQEVITQLTYLMFIRSLDDREFEVEQMEVVTGVAQEHIFPDEFRMKGSHIDGSELRWNVFKDFATGSFRSSRPCTTTRPSRAACATPPSVLTTHARFRRR